MKKLYEMFPNELDAYITREGQDTPRIAVLPVGSVEQHGVHLLLGCDGYIANAIAGMVAEKTEGVLLPMLPFSWIGGLRPFAGTIDMRPFVTSDYMEGVGVEVLKKGFDRLVLVNCHGGGREMVFSVARRIFKKTQKPVVTMYPTFIYDNWPEIIDIWRDGGMEFDWSAIEAGELSGALRYQGRIDLSEKVLQKAAEAVKAYGEDVQITSPDGLEKVFEMSEVGHDYHSPLQHVRPKADIVPETALRALDFMAEKIAWGALHAE